MTFRVSGLAPRYFSRVPICQRIARKGSTVIASTLDGMPLRIRAEPTKSPGIKSPSIRPSFDTLTLPRIIRETESGSLPCSMRCAPASAVIQDPILKTSRTFRGDKPSNASRRISSSSAVNLTGRRSTKSDQQQDICGVNEIVWSEETHDVLSAIIGRRTFSR